MGTVLTSLPVGERVGIAFSGGLDTSAAVAWMREKGAVPYAYTADLGQYDEPDLAGVPDAGQAVRRRGGPPGRLPRPSSCTRAWSRCSAAPSTSRTAGKTYFNTTPLGRAVTGTLLVRAMHDDGVDIWGDGSHLQGQRHRALLPLRAARQPGPAHLQAVARRGVRRRARRPRRDERVPDRARPALPRQRRRRRTRPTPTSGAPRTRPSRSRSSTRRWTSSSRSWASRHWDRDGGDRSRGRSRSRFEEGWPVAHQRRRVRVDQVELVHGGQRDRRPPRPRHERPDREPHHRGQEPRHLRGARAWRCCTSPTSGW